jgi:transcriptional regulator CtsR
MKDSGFGGGYVRIGVQSIKSSMSSLNEIQVSVYETVSHAAQAGLELTG